MKSRYLFLRTLLRTVLSLLLFCLFLPSAFSQSGAMYSAYPIVINSCGPTNFSDLKNNAAYANNFGQQSPEIWYMFTLSQATNVNISLCGSNFDTYLHLLDQNQSVITSNDDNGILCTGTRSSISQILGAGTYYIVAEGYSTNTGDIALSVDIQGSGQAAAGSGMAGAIDMGTFSGTGTFSDSRSNTDACLGNNLGQPSNDIFYRFVLTGTSTIELMHCGSGFDTYMHLLDQWGSVITFNDDNYTSPVCPGNQAYIQTTLPAGTYYVVSEGFSTASGVISTTINVGGGGSSGAPVISYTSPSSLQVGVVANLSPTNMGGAVSSSITAVTLAAGSGGFNNPLGTAVDGQGNIYIADAGNHKIRKITPSGAVSTLAGSGIAGYADGTGSSAQFQHPSALTVDASGNVYVSDQQNHRIRKISPSGNVTTVAGAGYAGYSDGNGTSAVFSSPIGLALDASGNLYVADYSNNRIRKITPSGVVSTFAGSGSAGLSNGSALASSFRNPMGISFDASGNLYVADRLNHSIRKITLSGTVSTVAGTGYVGYANGSGTAASFNYPNGVTSDASGNLYVADQLNNVIRKISISGTVSTLAGSGSASTVDGTGSSISFNSPYGLSIDAGGTLYVAESAGNSVRRLSTGAYTISPALPAGLNFDAATGTISGTPTAVSPMTVYTVTAYGNSGNGITSLSLEVTSGGICVTPSQDQNYIITYIPREPNMTTVASVVSSSCNKDLVQTSIGYFDGLGRPVQDVQVKGNGSGDHDIVMPKAYDEYGRERFSYLPYESSSGSGAYRPLATSEVISYYAGQPSGMSTAFSTPFSERRFEASPLSRVLEQGAPGNNWQIGTGHTVQSGYETNTAGEVNRWEVSGTGASVVASYSAGTLIKSRTTDENGHESLEYKDLQGKVVLKRVQSDAGYLSTYYIYDDLNNLRFVVPPKVSAGTFDESSTVFLQYIYAYRYDGINRLVKKKIPGKGWESMVYNKYDRLVATQDAKQSALGLWTFTKYNGVGRVVQTGETTDGRDQGALTAYVEGFAGWETFNNTLSEGYTNVSWPTSWNKLYQVNYYDGYTFPNHPGSAYNSAASEVTQTMTKGLLTASKIRNLSTGVMLWTVMYYDNKGQLRESISQNHVGGTDRMINTYNFTSAVTASVRTHSSTWEPGLVISNNYTYDHMGRKKQSWQRTGASNTNILVSERVYNGIGQLLHKKLHGNLQDVGYTYNERSWLSSQGSSLFSESLHYANASHGAVPQFNGNISEQEYYAPTGGSQYVTYEYDALNRLKAGNSTAGYSETGITYDEMGNILTLSRENKGSLSYYGYDGNRLTGLSGYKNGTFDYDANGNMKIDGMRGLEIGYNFLNLPESITGNRTVTYTYDAKGGKLKKVSGTQGTTDYVGGIEYQDEVLTHVQTEEGRAIRTGTDYNYEYTLTDHLGNNRVTFDTYGGTANKVGEEEYYPFGLNVHRQINAGNNYLYNKKELQAELEEYDYGARFYDPIIGRWSVVDNKSEKYFNSTPYAYAGNNPAVFVDYDGNDYGVNVDEKNKTITIKQTFYTDGTSRTTGFAKQAGQYFNDLSGKFGLKTKNGTYKINYEISVVESTKEKGYKNAQNDDTGNYMETDFGSPTMLTLAGDVGRAEEGGDFMTFSNWDKMDSGIYGHEMMHTQGVSHKAIGTQGKEATEETVGATLNYATKHNTKGSKIKATNSSNSNMLKVGEFDMPKVIIENKEKVSLSGKVIKL